MDEFLIYIIAVNAVYWCVFLVLANWIDKLFTRVSALEIKMNPPSDMMDEYLSTQ